MKVNSVISDHTPITMLSVGELKSILHPMMGTVQITSNEKRYVYGISGLAKLINSSIPTAQRWKNSGKLDPALRQIGRKIVCDADHVLELIKKEKEK